MATSWGTPIGWTGTRDAIAAKYGGTTYAGMETPTLSPNVLLFTDPKVGRENGYEFDGWSQTVKYSHIPEWAGSGHARAF